MVRIIALALFLGVWQIVSLFVRPVILPSPIAAVVGILQLMGRGELAQAIVLTVAVLAVGYAAAAGTGILLGLVIGWFKNIHTALSPYVYAIGSSPHFVFIPVIILWFGIGYEARIFYVFFSAILPIMINVMHGVRYTEENMLELARSLGASQLQTLRHIILGGSTTYIIVGLRLGLIRAFTATILSEMFFRLEGTGGLLVKYGSLFRTAEVFGLIIVIMALAQVSLIFVKFLEKKLLKWRGETH